MAGFDKRKKRPVVTNAVARELAGWCWSLAVLDDDRTPYKRLDANPSVSASAWQ
ncbi:hypothetical protein MALGJ_06300 [Mycolicibacter algericus]|uniref:Uncharacterized protein n=1 Tax=Mycolicibacter algericus TaxID=1288388 RepID=A0A7I9Y5U8_MYCAL|nr:hypothetical protein MALGJ_06300 [Mycolicibacter algericus]